VESNKIGFFKDSTEINKKEKGKTAGTVATGCYYTNPMVL
jgi:hypothetical protein